MLYVDQETDLNKASGDTQQNDSNVSSSSEKYEWEIDYVNLFLHSLLHLGALAGIYLSLSLSASPKTTFWAWFWAFLGLHGVTAGSHRLYAHKSFKAKLPLRILLMVFQTIALLHHLHDWASDHRVHHKYVDTNADPHNSKRGFFFCHIGWLLMKKRPEYYEKLKKMDISDLEADPVIMFQKNYYFILAPLIGFIIPTAVPVYFWGENVYKSFLVASLARYAVSMHCVFLVNSLAHHYGMKPYDKNIRPVENVIVSILVMGEGWHNFHHTFPWDYKTGEFGFYLTNTTTAFIDFMAWIGWAYDLKQVNEQSIQKRALRTGDGSLKIKDKLDKDNNSEKDDNVYKTLWGWEDVDMHQNEKNFAKITYHQKC